MVMAKALHESVPRQVGIRELRANLSRLLDAVKEGREIVVTDRGKPVARLVPLPEDDPLERLISLGWATRGTGVRKPIRPEDLVKARGSVTELLIQMREEDR